MDTSILIIIIVLIIASIVGSVIFTKKEQAAALQRQQIASFCYRADKAQDLYDGLQTAGLERITYQFLLERIITNLQAAYQINARYPGIKVRLNSAKSTLSNLDNVQFQVQMPSAMAELHTLVARLNKLVKYLIILFQKRAIPEHQYSQLMPAIQRTLLKFDAEGHIKMGHQAANNGQPGTAKQCYLHAKEKLLSFGSEDSYVSAQLEKVEELINSLEKEGSITTSAVDVETPVDKTPSPDTGNVIAPKNVQNPEKIKAKETQEELNKRSEADANSSQKKKW